MPRHCSVCAHPSRPQIDRELVEGAKALAISRKYGLGDDAVARHRVHIPRGPAPEPIHETAAESAARGADLVVLVTTLHEKAMSLLHGMESSNDRRGATGALREALRCLEVAGRLTNQISSGVDVTVNIVNNPTFIQMQSLILGALDPYPEARIAVVNALTKALE